MKALIKPQPCDEVVTHWNPHPDEGLGYFLGKRFAKHIFRGIENAKLVLLKSGYAVFFSNIFCSNSHMVFIKYIP